MAPAFSQALVISGGKGTLAGPLVGGVIFGILPELTRGHMLPEVQSIVYGALMILIVYFLPAGIVPAVQRWWAAFQKRRDQSARDTSASNERRQEAA